MAASRDEALGEVGGRGVVGRGGGDELREDVGEGWLAGVHVLWGRGMGHVEGGLVEAAAADEEDDDCDYEDAGCGASDGDAGYGGS